MQCANVCVLLQGKEIAELEGIRGPLAPANDDHGGPGVGHPPPASGVGFRHGRGRGPFFSFFWCVILSWRQFGNSVPRKSTHVDDCCFLSDVPPDSPERG